MRRRQTTTDMFLAQLTNELWKLFGKKRTYIGFGAFVLAQSVMLLVFKYGSPHKTFEGLLANRFYERPAAEAGHERTP